MEAIYFLVGLLSSVVGAIAGIGGGIIIKPVLDVLGDFDAGTIGILSTTTVFMMAGVSLAGAAKSGKKIWKKTSFLLAGGSIIGGVVGQYVLDLLLKHVHDDQTVIFGQSGMLAFLMLVIFFLSKSKKKNTYEFHHVAYLLGIGFGLGIIGSFLGIGGGPLNMAVLALVFFHEHKRSSRQFHLHHFLLPAFISYSRCFNKRFWILRFVHALVHACRRSSRRPSRFLFFKKDAGVKGEYCFSGNDYNDLFC